MNNYFANIEAIASGKGSPQARDEGCQMCQGAGEETVADDAQNCEICFGRLDEYAQYGVCSGCREDYQQ